MTRPTQDELQGARPDPNPFIPCDDCGETYKFKDYWKARIVDGERVDDHNDRDATWRCDECHRNHKHRQQNQSLTSFDGGSA